MAPFPLRLWNSAIRRHGGLAHVPPPLLHPRDLAPITFAPPLNTTPSTVIVNPYLSLMIEVLCVSLSAFWHLPSR